MNLTKSVTNTLIINLAFFMAICFFAFRYYRVNLVFNLFNAKKALN